MIDDDAAGLVQTLLISRIAIGGRYCPKVDTITVTLLAVGPDHSEKREGQEQGDSAECLHVDSFTVEI